MQQNNATEHTFIGMAPYQVTYANSENDGCFSQEKHHMVWVNLLTKYIGSTYKDELSRKGFNYCQKAKKFTNPGAAEDHRNGGT